MVKPKNEATHAPPNIEKNQKEPIKLDEAAKIVFDPTNPMAIHWINYFFGENYQQGEVKIYPGKTEYFDDKYDLIRTDISFIVVQGDRTTEYHIEVQTYKDKSMVIRMFSYGFAIATDKEFDENKIYDFPKQRVIFLEENPSIGDSLTLKMRMENGDIFDYEVKTIKNWEITLEDIEKNRIYPFLSLQLNNHRKALKKAEKKQDKAEIKRLARLIRQDTEVLQKLARNYYKAENLTEKDYAAIVDGIRYMASHLNRVYLHDENLEKEVNTMTRMYMDEALREQTREQTREETKSQERFEYVSGMLQKGIDEETIKEIAKIDDAQLAQIKQQMQSE